MIELIHQHVQLTNPLFHNLSHLKEGKHFSSKQHQTVSQAKLDKSSNPPPKNLSQVKIEQTQPNKQNHDKLVNHLS